MHTSPALPGETREQLSHHPHRFGRPILPSRHCAAELLQIGKRRELLDRRFVSCIGCSTARGYFSAVLRLALSASALAGTS
jgi:hypothetical protein